MKRLLQIIILTGVQGFVFGAGGRVRTGHTTLKGVAGKEATTASGAGSKNTGTNRDANGAGTKDESKDKPAGSNGTTPAVQNIGLSAPPSEAQSYLEQCKADKTVEQTAAGLQKCVAGFRGSSSDKEKSCRDSYAAYKKAMNELNKSCNDAGLGGDCKEAVKTCYENSGNEEFSTLGQAASAFGLQGVAELDKKCPTMTQENWDRSHEKLENKMNTAKKDLIEAKKKVQEAKEKFNKENTKLSKEYNDLNKEQAKLALESKSKKRQANVDAQEAVQKIKDAIFNNSMKTQEYNQQISNIAIEKAGKLAEASAAIAKFKCTSDLQEKLKKMGTAAASGFSSMMASGSSSRNSTQAVYKACLDSFLLGRQAMIQSFESKNDLLTKQLVRQEEMQKNLEDSLKTAQTTAAEAQADMSKADQDAQADYESRVKEIQTQMTNNYNESVEQLKVLNENQARLEQDVTRTSNAFMGSVSNTPESGATSTFKDASSKFGEKENAKKVAQNECTCMSSTISTDSGLCRDGKEVEEVENPSSAGGTN